MENKANFSKEEFYEMYNKLPIEGQNLLFETVACINKFGDEFREELEPAVETRDVELIKKTVSKWSSRIYVDELFALLDGQQPDSMADKAKKLAKTLFAGVTDKAGVDYFEGHLSSVAALVETDEEKAAAYLHDVLEDTDYPEDKLREEFGDRIVDAVLLVTHKGHVDEEGYLNYVRNLKASGNELAIAVKIADLTNNSDYTRLGASSPDELKEKDRRRWEKYQRSLDILKGGE